MKTVISCIYLCVALAFSCGAAMAQATFSADDVRDAISRFGPIMKLHPSEKYKMDDPEGFLKAVKPNIIAELIKNPGSYDYEESQVNRISVSPPDHIYSVEKALPISVAGIYNNPEFKAFLEIPNQSSVLAGDQARASRLIAVTQQKNSLYIAFWFFYPFNGPGRAFIGPGCKIDWKDDEKGRHFGDWEHVTLKVQKVAGKLSLSGIYLSRHSFSPWYGGKLTDSFDFRGEHPIIFIAINSHAHYPKGGHDYIYDDNYHGPGDTLRVCAYDSPRDGGQEFDTSSSDKRRIIASNIAGVPAEQNNWYQFTLPWGQYIRNKTDYTVGSEKESENGPSGPIDHGRDQLHFAHTPSAFGFSDNAIYALVDTDDKQECCELQHNDFFNNKWNGWNGGFQWKQGQYTTPPKFKQISMVTLKTGLGLFAVGSDSKLYANMRSNGYWQQSWR